MRIVTPSVRGLSFVIGLCLASVAFGQTVNFGITSAGPNNLGGVYTDPYNGSVNGNSVLAFCDDFTDEIGPPQYWTALDTNLSQLPSDTVYFGVGSASQTTDYIAMAILAEESLTATNATTQEEYSFALWDVFDPTLLPDISTSDPYGTVDPGEVSQAETFVANALTEAATYSSGLVFETETGLNVNIYTPTTNGLTPETASGRPQEFITVTTPEASTPVLLAIDLLGFIALVGFLRKRSVLRGI